MSALTPAELDALVVRIRDGDREAFVELIEATQDEVRCFIAVVALSADQIEEAVQAAYVTAYEHLDDYRVTGTFLPWLKGIARNRLRQETAHRRRWLSADQAFFESLLQSSEPPAAEVPQADLLLALEECLGRLAEPAQRLVRDFYRDPSALEALAREQGRTRAAVAMALSRIRGVLRDCLSRKGLTW